MSAIWKQLWKIEPIVDIDSLTPEEVNQLFVSLRGREVNTAISDNSAEKIYQNKTDHDKWKFEVDMTNRVMLRCREFVDLASAESHRAWHETSHGTVFPESGPAWFTLIRYEVLDDTTLDQVTV
jgi:hypothetical protein